MSKDKFLRDLEKKLSILSEEERKETIDEYRDIIEEKVKHGKKESEAVKEFGSIDELAKEILNAYKINPDYNRNNTGDKAKDFVDGAEEIIRKGAKKISKVTDDVVDSLKKSDFECTTSNVFEIVVKVIILLIFLAILKIPIYLASEIGAGIFGIGFEPFSSIFSFMWKVLIEIVYLGICVLLIVKLITDYTKKQPNDKDVKKKDDNLKSNSEVKSNKKSVRQKRKNDTFETIVLVLIRLFVIFIFIIPFIFIAGLFVIGIIALIYLLCKGIGVYGFLIVSLGGLGFICCIIDLIYRGLIVSKKVYLYPFIINIILIIIGGVMSLSYIFDFEYHDYLPQDKYEIKTETYVEDIQQKTVISAYESNIVIDNNLEDNKMKLEITYYPEFVNIKKHEDNDSDRKYLTFNTYHKEKTFSLNNKYTKIVIDDVKNKKLYNYSLFDKVSVKIYVNDKTKDLVEN